MEAEVLIYSTISCITILLVLCSHRHWSIINCLFILLAHNLLQIVKFHKNPISIPISQMIGYRYSKLTKRFNSQLANNLGMICLAILLPLQYLQKYHRGQCVLDQNLQNSIRHMVMPYATRDVSMFSSSQCYCTSRSQQTGLFLHSYSISAWCNTESGQVCFHICAKSDEDNSLIGEQDSFWSLADLMEKIYTHAMPCSVLSTVSHLTSATVLQYHNITHTSYNFYLVVPEFMLCVKAISETEFI